MGDELRDLLGTPSPVAIRGETIEVRAFRFRELPQVADLVWKALAAAGARGVEAEDFGAEAVLRGSVEVLTALLALATGKPVGWFEDLTAAEGLALTDALLEQNGDFFVRLFSGRLLETSVRVLRAALRGWNPAGASSGPATASPTS